MSRQYILECCVDSVESALTAAECGAGRLELCSGLVIGGITPTPALYHAVRERTDIKIHVLIRPRFGDFLYSDTEFEVIRREVEQFRLAGADGVVIGCLLPDGALHLEQLKQLKEAAGTMHVTLHRAFDMCADPFAALEQASLLGIHTILTSGQQDSCLAGLPLLKELDTASAGRIQIMAGAGVNASVIETLLSETSLTCFHMSGKKILSSNMAYRNPGVHMGLPGISEYEIYASDPDAIRRAAAVIRAAAK